MNSKILSLKTVNKRIEFVKEKGFYSLKLLKKKRFVLACGQINRKILDPRNAKEHYQSFIRKKNTKSETITYQPKTFEKPNIVDEKSVITEYPKRLHKLANNLSHAEKVGFNSSLNSDTQKSKNFSNKKYVKVTK